MEELYKVMDDLLEVEFQMKAGMDIPNYGRTDLRTLRGRSAYVLLQARRVGHYGGHTTDRGAGDYG